MSSFTSLALSPVPVVTFNVAIPSRTIDAVAASRRFNIHVLAGDEFGAAVADRFSKGNREEGVGLAMESDDTCEIVWDGCIQDPPILKANGILYILRCRLLEDRGSAVDKNQRREALVRVQDHVIVLGEVLGIFEGNENGKDKNEKFGLVYADRRYRTLGNVLARN